MNSVTQKATKCRSACPIAYLPVAGLKPDKMKNLDVEGRKWGKDACESKIAKMRLNEAPFVKLLLAVI